MKHRLVSLPDLKAEAKRSLTQPIIYSKANLIASSFLVQWGQGKTFCIKTYGCQANVRDSEIIRGYLLSLKMKETDDFSDADFILFNTCAVRENAENHLYGQLGECKKYYKKNNKLIIAVCGCVMQEEFAVKHILKHFPYVSLMFGTNNITSFYSLLNDVVQYNQAIVDIQSNSNLILEGMPNNKNSRLSQVVASVNIMYGCNKFCTYCIVPYTRGRERSRKMEDIIAEVECLKEQGYKQVTLLGQNVDAYGKDFNDEYAFSKLLEKVAQTGIERVRFLTPYPSDFKLEVFDVMAKYKNIMPYLHLPVQSGSSNILKKMNRRYTREEYLNLVKEVRKRVPDIFLTTDIIVGFPTETEEDFLDTLSLCKEVEYDAAFTFIYSPRKGTPAASLQQVDEKVKHERFNRLKQTIDELTQKRAKTFLGKELEVLFENVSEKDSTKITGYDRHGKLVHVKGDKSLIGQIRKVKIVDGNTFSLIGELIDE